MCCFRMLMSSSRTWGHYSATSTNVCAHMFAAPAGIGNVLKWLECFFAWLHAFELKSLEEIAKWSIPEPYHMRNSAVVLNINCWPWGEVKEAKAPNWYGVCEWSICGFLMFWRASEFWKWVCSVGTFSSWSDRGRPWSSWCPAQYLPPLITAHLWQPEHLSGPPTALPFLHFLLHPTCMLLTVSTHAQY